MAIGKKLRFEIFRRDVFACRYCGATAQGGAVLEIDHVLPRSRGGWDAPSNLLTACEDCNAGKGATPMSAPVVEDVPAHLFRASCSERGVEDPPVVPRDEAVAETYDDGRLSFAYQVLGKGDEWDIPYWMRRAREVAAGFDASQEELEVCAAVVGLEAVFDERERLRDIVMGFLKALPNGERVWKQAISSLKASEPQRPLTSIDITEEVLLLVLGETDGAEEPA